jgi:hypothetical protein
MKAADSPMPFLGGSFWWPWYKMVDDRMTVPDLLCSSWEISAENDRYGLDVSVLHT